LRARVHGGFSINGAVRVEADDRAALERLLRYLLRPALSTQRLSYDAREDWVRYRPKKGPPGDPEVFQWKPLDFLERFAKLIPPARLHLVRYHGALAPRSPLRPAVTRSARDGLACEELVAGVAAGAVGAALAAAGRAAGEALGAAARSWAACLRRVFEVEALLCPGCAKEMTLVAFVNDDGELRRLMAHLNLPIETSQDPARKISARLLGRGLPGRTWCGLLGWKGPPARRRLGVEGGEALALRAWAAPFFGARPAPGPDSRKVKSRTFALPRSGRTVVSGVFSAQRGNLRVVWRLNFLQSLRRGQAAPNLLKFNRDP